MILLFRDSSVNFWLDNTIVDCGIAETQKLLMEIQEKKIPDVTMMDININTKIQILESLIYKRPLNINVYQNILVPIVTKEKCEKCQRQAAYIMSDNKTKFCWTHSQNIE